MLNNINKAFQKNKYFKYVFIFITTYVIGYIVHGAALFSVQLYFDDLAGLANFPGTTYTSGRWFLQVLYEINSAIMGSHVNAKGYIGIVSFALIALISCIFAKHLEIKHPLSLVLLSSAVVTFPYVTSLFGYTFTAIYDYVAIIMALLAAVLIWRANSVKKLAGWGITAAVLLGLSMAVYQSTLCIYLAFIIVLAIKTSLDENKEKWASYIARGVKYIACAAGGYLVYYISNKIVLSLKGLSLSSYQNIDSMGLAAPKQMIKRIFTAYKEFFFPSVGESYSLCYTNAMLWAYRIVLAVIILACLYYIISALKAKNYSKACQLAILFCGAPGCINSIFLAVDCESESSTIYSLMMFANIMVFVFLVYVFDKACPKAGAAKLKEQLAVVKSKGAVPAGQISAFCKGAACCVAAVLLIYTSAYYAYTANICYTKAAVQQEQTISYFNRLIERIQSTDGYSQDLPVAYINGSDKDTTGLDIIRYSSDVFNDAQSIKPYNIQYLINTYNWQVFMNVWCGYNPEVADEQRLEELSDLEEVAAMPCYPDSGSIRVIDGTVVVKFAD
ncbi:MAG: glucosyltransferase domain-containing protein [Clostridiales bacterium]|nr:glucosyltransferase domain-containing protein [Clostridiales bacterium]